MKALLFVSLVVSASLTASPLATHHNSELDITQYVEKVATPNHVITRFTNRSAMTWEEKNVTIEEIVNLGEKVWKLVEENQPVLSVKTTYANALPKGVDSGTELEGFSNVQYESYRTYGKNGFGMTVYDLTYTLVHRYGGSYQGKGRYLENVSVIPTQIDVLWGYTVNLNVGNVSTVNVGTQIAPVAGLIMELNFSVSTIIKKGQFNAVFDFRGDSPKVQAIQ